MFKSTQKKRIFRDIIQNTYKKSIVKILRFWPKKDLYFFSRGKPKTCPLVQVTLNSISNSYDTCILHAKCGYNPVGSVLIINNSTNKNNETYCIIWNLG